MTNISIVGNGNVATHLFKALSEGKTKTCIINPRTLLDLCPQTQIIIISVSDNAIEKVASSIAGRLRDFNGIVVHTSGSTSIEILEPYFQHFGVLYPLQTFSKEITIGDYGTIPFFVEGNSAYVENKLLELAHSISTEVYKLNSEKRKILHLSSVFACNYVNCMYSIASDILKNENIPFDVLHPLICQTASKIKGHSPKECQTGPARRGDKNILMMHENILKDNPEVLKIYHLLSTYIFNHHNGQNKIK